MLQKEIFFYTFPHTRKLKDLSNLKKIFAYSISSPDKISIFFFNSPAIYILNDPSLSPFAIGASIGVLYSITALIIFFFSFWNC
jgi:hypothetical protein